MGSLNERNRSLWVTTTDGTSYPSLDGDANADVVVIGAGITGLTTARLLAEAGVNVVVLEADHVCSGVTGYTTAKITSLHKLIYASLLEKHSLERGRAYGEANEAAIAEIARLVERDGIDCDFQRAPSFTYTTQESNIAQIEAEVEAATRLGLPVAFTTETDLPYEVRAAVRFDGQAHFHPRRYCLGLADAVVASGGRVFERTRATNVREGSSCHVTTDRGTVTSQQVVVATHLPFMNDGAYFARAHPYRSYALSARIEGQPPRGMYINVEAPTRSVRPGPEGRVIVSGQGHKVGQEDDTNKHYEALDQFTRDTFGGADIDHRWSAQDYSTVDGIPYVGRLTPGSDAVFVGTGYGKWGMTNGTAAGMIIRDLIVGRDSPWAEAFDSTRVKPRASIKDLVTENLDVAKRFVADRLHSLRRHPASELAPGEGAIVEYEGEKVAAYRDDEGALHTVSPVCTHMGCEVAFNTAERTWDCPCHGSRFDADGRVIQAPAYEDLARKGGEG